MSNTLALLPSELLSQIVSHVDTACSLTRLSLTCKRLHDYIESDGFGVFVRSRFPSIQTPPYWKDAAHALTSLSKAWHRKAFIARCLTPGIAHDRAPNDRQRHGYGRRQRGQTMGYQPVIDSYVDWTGGDWSSRKEVLAWGAGVDLIVRVKSMGDEVERAWQDTNNERHRHKYFDQHHHRNEWAVHRETGLAEGRDDVTSVNLLRPNQNPTNSSEKMVVGRASGRLDVVMITATDSQSRQISNGRPIISATVNSTPDPLVAACLSHSAIALYKIPVEEYSSDLGIVGNVSAIPLERSSRIWSTQFLRHDRLALGFGHTRCPIHIYNIGPDGIARHPVKKFDFAEAGLTTAERGSWSVYSILPLAPSSAAGGAEGDLFLTGGFDGAVRYVSTWSLTGYLVFMA